MSKLVRCDKGKYALSCWDRMYPHEQSEETVGGGGTPLGLPNAEDGTAGMGLLETALLVREVFETLLLARACWKRSAGQAALTSKGKRRMRAGNECMSRSIDS